MPPRRRPRKAVRVLLFFVYFFGLGVGVPGLAVGLIQMK